MEDEDKVFDVIVMFILEEIDEDDVFFDILEMEGYFGNLIKVVNVEIKRSKVVRKFLEYFKELFSEEDKKYFFDYFDEKVDEEGIFYVCFNK